MAFDKEQLIQMMDAANLYLESINGLCKRNSILFFYHINNTVKSSATEEASRNAPERKKQL